MTVPKPEQIAAEAPRPEPKRLPWRRPMLRRIDAVDASKSRARTDALHLS